MGPQHRSNPKAFFCFKPPHYSIVFKHIEYPRGFIAQESGNVCLKLCRMLMNKNMVQEFFTQRCVQMMLREYMSSLRIEYKNRREDQNLTPEGLIFIRWEEKEGLGPRDKRTASKVN